VFELDIYHDSSVLTYSGVSKGEKLDNVTDEEGNPRTMTLLGNYLDDHAKVLAYSTSRARTSGDGTEGDLVHVTYELADGESLPSQVTFHLGLANLPGTSMDPELLNVVCGYPSEDSPVVVSTAAMATDESGTIPDQFTLNQNYPNPFNPITTIDYAVPTLSNTNISLYDLQGRKIKTLIDSIHRPGYYKIKLTLNDLYSGIYIVKIFSENIAKTRKITLIK
jgi:hypothetical protein